MTDSLPQGFLVDQDHLGTGEATWMCGGNLTALSPMDVPDVDGVVVVVAPHPDDEVLGSGGLLQALAALGHRVEVCAVTDGEASHRGVVESELRAVRTEESERSLRRLGLTDVTRTRLRLPDGQVARAEAELTRRLAELLEPGSLCVGPWSRDGHPDHDACGRAAEAAAAATGAQLLQYLVWAWHWSSPSDTRVPWTSCRRLDLDRRQLLRKRWAAAAFISQTRPFGPQPAPPILPAPILRRFWRPFEVYVT